MVFRVVVVCSDRPSLGCNDRNVANRLFDDVNDVYDMYEKHSDGVIKVVMSK